MTGRPAICPDRAPDFVIGDVRDPYMQRWWLIPRNRFVNVYLHHIRHDDDDRALHDHPWPSVSFLVQGRIGEFYRRRGADRYREARKWWPVFRSTRFAHRLVLPKQGQSAWTLFITGPRLRDWGFHCPKDWVPSRQFVEPDRPGEIGRGCGEE
ncbi:MAG: hypothetical protein AAF557_27735 [Pseudomonadota bacterium]